MVNKKDLIKFIYSCSIRQGKVYRYKIKEYTPSKLIEFVQSGYLKQTNPESVPIEGASM